MSNAGSAASLPHLPAPGNEGRAGGGGLMGLRRRSDGQLRVAAGAGGVALQVRGGMR